jgi:lysophospholipase L1-like esterase
VPASSGMRQIGVQVKQTRWSVAAAVIVLLIVPAAIAAILQARAYFAQPPGSEHRTARQSILYYTLSRVEDPIIVLGDSIVEASTLPRSACGHVIVNAGLNGASTTSGLSDWLAAALGDKRAFAIIVSLGTNDALTPAPATPQVFVERYGSLLAALSRLTPRLFVVDIPPVEARERMTADMQRQATATLRDFRAGLPELARRSDAMFLPLAEMPAPFTIDGVHLNADGYRIWDAAVMQGAARACG